MYGVSVEGVEKCVWEVTSKVWGRVYRVSVAERVGV